MTESNTVAENLRKSITSSFEPLAITIAEASRIPGAQLESSGLQAKKIEHELNQYMAYAKRRCKEGFRYCHEAFRYLPELERLEIEQNISDAFNHFDTVAHAIEMSAKILQGSSWKELLGLLDATVLELYNGAKSLFDAGRFPEAEAGFFFLTTIDCTQYIFWIGLGHAAFRLGNLNQAINAYETAESIQPGAIWPHIYVANCFEAMTNFEEALVALHLAQEDYQKNGVADAVLERALIERINQLKPRFGA